MYDLIVAGGGPAGLAAALYALRNRLNVLLISKDLGGKTNKQLELPWLSSGEAPGASLVRGVELVRNLRGELDTLQFPYQNGSVAQVTRDGEGFTLATEGETRSQPLLQARALVIATGTRQTPLNVPGEKEYLWRGVSYSALSFTQMFSGREAAVIGEGELAIRSTAHLATVARQVYLVCSHTELLGELDLGSRLRNANNVRILEGYQVQEIRGDSPAHSGFARSLVVKDPDGKHMELAVDGIFIEKGLVPNSQMVAGLVAIDPAGRIQVDSAARTSQAGIFAAGDVTDIYAEHILVAVSEGVKASLSAYDYLLPGL